MGGNEWSGAWRRFCEMTPGQWLSIYNEQGMDTLIEDPVKDLVDERLLRFQEGSIKEKLSDELLGRFGGELFDLLKPMVEQLVRSAIDRPWLSALAGLAEVAGSAEAPAQS